MMLHNQYKYKRRKNRLLKILGNDTHCINTSTDTMNKIKKHTSTLEYIKQRISKKKR